MTIERKKKLDVLEEKAAAAVEYNHKKAREEIEVLKAEIQKLKIDSDAFKSRARLSDKRLREMISDKDNKLRASAEENASLQERNKDLTSKLDDNSRKITSLKRRLSQSQLVKTHNHDSQVDLELIEAFQRANEFKECIEETRSPHSQCCETDEWAENVEFRGFNSIEVGKFPNEIDTDSKALRALSKHQDLIEEPTECWLRKHLDLLHDQSMRMKAESKQDSTATVMMESAAEELPKIQTPIKSAPKVDQSSPMTISTKSSLGHAESYSFVTPSKTSSSQPTDKEVNMLSNNRRIVRYQNGTQKEILRDGTVIIRYTNGDVKTSYLNAGIIVYYYASSKVKSFLK